MARWRENRIGFHLSEVNPKLVRHASALPPAPSPLLVPLCGKTLDLAWLGERGYPVTGIELSPQAVEAYFEERNATSERQQLGSLMRHRHGNVAILCGDFFEVDPAVLEPFSGFYDRAALVALSESVRGAYVQHLTQLLAADARGLLVTFEYPPEQMDGPPFSVSDAEVRHHYGSAFELELLAEDDILHEEPRFRERGLTRLVERAYSLRRRRAAG
jgi:thiopurine S-methyltransferase